jgi:glycerol kinase
MYWTNGQNTYGTGCFLCLNTGSKPIILKKTILNNYCMEN